MRKRLDGMTTQADIDYDDIDLTVFNTLCNKMYLFINEDK
jgi:hypothetical protein